MRRKPGALVPLEISVLEAALALEARSQDEFHGYMLAREMKAIQGAKFRTAYGTLYRTLERMQGNGLLESHWEDPTIAEAESRPRRRLYRVTEEGHAAYQRALVPAEPRRRGAATSSQPA
jgi:DNA-binding PadR family transcriptional regulator